MVPLHPAAADQSCPPTVAGIGTCETLLTWALRRMFHLGGASPGVHATICTALGAEAGCSAYLGVRALLRLCAAHQRRPLAIDAPGSGAAVPTPDESALLQLLAATQWERSALRDATLGWLLRPRAHAEARRTLHLLADAMTAGGLVLADPHPLAAPSAERLDPVARPG